MKITISEAWKLETQIMSRMLERVGLKTGFVVLAAPDFFKKFWIPLLDSSPEEQDWDMALWVTQDYHGRTGGIIPSIWVSGAEPM